MRGLYFPLHLDFHEMRFSFWETAIDSSRYQA